MGKPSVQTRILVLIAVPLVMLLILGGYILLHNMGRLVSSWEGQRVSQVMDFAVDRLEKTGISEEAIRQAINEQEMHRILPDSIETLSRGADVEVLVFSFNGEPLYRSSGSPLANIVGWMPEIQAMIGAGDLDQHMGRVTIPNRNGEDRYSYRLHLMPDRNLVLVAAAGEERQNIFLGEFVTGLIGLGIALFMILLLVAIYVGRVIVRKPVDALNEAAGRIAHRQAVATIPVQSNDEFGQLARRMEAMARDLDFYYTELSRERDFNAAILDAAGALMVVLDVEGRIMAFNSACAELTERKSADVIGTSFWDVLVSRSQLPLARRSFEDCLSGPTASDFEGTFIRHDGKTFSLAWRFSRIEGGEDGATSVVASGLDVTQRKRAEEALVLAKESAEQANNAKSEFLANMSHELRTPLNAILGFSETMMLEVFGEIGSDRYRDYIKDIHVSAEHLLGIINDILDLSKIEAGSMELDEAELDMSGLIQSAIDMARSNPHTDVPTIRANLQQSLPHLIGNQRSFMQVLLNILSNAVKFTNGDGYVDVLVTAERGHALTVSIQDTGCGIPEAEMDRIFNPFSQVEFGNATQEGAGLGLTITKSLVEMMGGRIELNSQLGVGTTVILTFPEQRLSWSQAAE